MGWLRLSGTFADHPKTIASGNAAVGMFVRLACWSAEHETDGFVPVDVAKRYGSRAQLGKLTSARGATRPLLEMAPGGFRLRDFLEYNPSHEQMTRQRALKTQRQHRWRAPDVDASRDASRDGVSSPFHSSPLQSLSVSHLPLLGDAETDAETIAMTALAIHARNLATRHAAPNRRAAYARTVIANAADHLPELTRIARETNAIDAQKVVEMYEGRGAATGEISHPATCPQCDGTGWADTPDGVVRCQEPN